MDLDQFCLRLADISLDNAQRAIAILWFHDKKNSGIRMSAGELARIILHKGLGNPNQTALDGSIAKTRLVLRNKAGFQLKPTARATVQSWVKSAIDASPAEVDSESGYLPKAIWEKTRGYIEKIAHQVNGCVHYHFFDGASVLLRRLVETLLIECYEHLGIESRIKGGGGNYLMLSGIITDAVDKKGLTLGRETAKVLSELKTVGDRSAHNRRYNAIKADLDNLRMGVRLVVDELVQLAELRGDG